MLRRNRASACLPIVALLLAAGATVWTSGAVSAQADGAPAPIDGTAPLPTESVAELEDLVVESGEPIGLTGADAVEALTTTGLLDDVAASVSMTSHDLTNTLLDDPALFVAADATLGYADVFAGGTGRDEVATQLDAAPGASTGALTMPPGTDVGRLESYPGATLVLYLDFTGHVTSGDPAWNAGSPQPGTSAPYPGTAEQKYEIWRRVAEDFAPFAVNVTTKDPGTAGIVRSSESDTAYGQRVVVSPTNWTQRSSTLGIALVGTFGTSRDRPAFVFTQTLTPSEIAEATAHEAGHTFGLHHDGTTAVAGDDYYGGHGVWKPIMGNPIDGIVTQWSKGEYGGADNREDDLLVIATRVGYRPDDVENSAAHARRLVPGSSFSGMIGVGGDVDVFVFDVAAGPVTVLLTPQLVSGWNLLSRLRVYSPSGDVAWDSTPVPSSAGWSSRFELASAPAGRYTVEVRGASYLTNVDGFTAYGSLGAYDLSIAGIAAPGTPPPSPDPDSRLSPVTPDRLLDTRIGLGGHSRLRAGQTVRLQVTGRSGIPVGATAALLNIVAVDPSTSGYVTAFPCTSSRPLISSLNYSARQVVANATIAVLSSSGQVCLYARSSTDIVVDTTGWLGPTGASRYTPRGPNRVMDTRTGLGGSARLAAGQTVELPLSLPAGSTAAALNITAVNGATDGYITAFPCASNRPFTATINYVAREVRPNSAIVGVTGGKVCIFSLAAVDVVVDLVGVFGASGMSYRPAQPERLLDTRETGGYVGAGEFTSFRFALRSGDAPPESATRAVSVNVAAVDHPAPGFVTSYDCVTRRVTATINPQVGQVNSNGAIAPLTSGRSCLYSLSGGDLVVDLVGWWTN